MLRSFEEVVKRAKELDQEITISVAAAQDKDVLLAIKSAQDMGLAKAILVGDADLIKPLMIEIGLSPEMSIIHEPDMSKVGLVAVSLIREGKAQVLMKGLLNSSDFLRAVLNGQEGLRTGRLLSHLACLEIPGEEKLVFLSDGGMNIAPTLAEKKDILINSLLALQNVGINCPNVAILTANEMVNPKMPATVDAQALVAMSDAGELLSCIIEGPIAMDVAMNPEAGKHKGITSKIAGKVDLFLVPNIETGNVASKVLIHFAKAQMAGIVLGATHPIVLTSRAETPKGKLYSMALACLAASGVQKGGQ
ncbi:phosphate acyltransferase [Pelosinus sp. sgz500959]|uniref:phosphate acyltransferase n=1 Tax=Pelosinus sp. sgz500959 TaxID=3242472 RepID=UPI003670B823